jgi:hypothetical protein
MFPTVRPLCPGRLAPADDKTPSLTLTALYYPFFGRLTSPVFPDEQSVFAGPS